jgi:hypothetical protein
MLQLKRHPDPVSHPDAPGQLHIPVASLWMHLEFFICKLEKPQDALICHVLSPTFLFFTHGGVM